MDLDRIFSQCLCECISRVNTRYLLNEGILCRSGVDACYKLAENQVFNTDDFVDVTFFAIFI